MLPCPLFSFSTKNWHLLQLLIFNTLWKFRVESRNEAVCALEIPGRTGLQVVRYFQKPILWYQFMYRLVSRKVRKSFMVMSAPCDYQYPSQKEQKPSAKKACLIACTHPSPKLHIYWPSSLPLGEVTQSYLRRCLPSCSPHIAPNETWLTTLMLCICLDQQASQHFQSSLGPMSCFTFSCFKYPKWFLLS